MHEASMFYFAFTVTFSDIELAAWTDCLNMASRNSQQLEIASAFFGTKKRVSMLLPISGWK